MSKHHKKPMPVTMPKDKHDFSIKIKLENHKLPNPLHFSAQLNFPALVQEDKRYKKPKYKHRVFDEY